MPFTLITNSFATGEISPSVWGRTDLAKWHNGASTMRNFYVNFRGGASSRAGLVYVGTCKQSGASNPPRDIQFQFSNLQGYALEFGDRYMRIKVNGAYVTEPTKAVTSVSSAGLFIVAMHGYSVGDWVFDLGNTGFSGLTWIVNSATTNTFTVTDLFGNAITSATASTGGTVARIYTVVSPYAAVDLPYLKFTQSADTMTLTCVNTNTNTEYSSYELTRFGITNWTFTADTFSAGISAPTGVSAVAQSSTTVSTWYSYVVTAISATGEESVSSLAATVQNNDIGLFQGTNTISWNPVVGATSYNVYKATPSFSVGVPVSSLYGFMGTALGTSLSDTNITADFTSVPPVHTNPFARGAITAVTPTGAGTNYSQQTISYAVTTATGTGFSGSPVVVGGSLSGFVIFNEGQNYQAGDTIAFTDSGGGLATGAATFTANPADTNSMNLGGIFIHFATAPAPAPNAGGQFIYSEIENTTALTVQTLANNLNASNILSLAVASYSASGSVLTITYKTPGAVGNAYVMSTVSAPVTFSGTHLTGGGTAGSGATATLVIGAETGTYPGTVAYYQQRRVYAASLNEPDTYWMSQPGSYLNMDASIPTTDSDAITGTPWAQQVNGIQFMVPMPGGLVVLTGKGAWQVNGGSSAAITPADQTATPQAYNGCSDIVVPLTINYDVLYMDYTNNVARDLSYNFFVNIYTGNDLTILANQMFQGYTISQWVYAEQPFKLVWAVRNDGVLLCLTYLKEQDVYAWSRHDTNGEIVSICTIREPPVDAVYVIVRRYVQGAWRYYSERMDNRNWPNVETCICSDAALKYPMPTPNATLTAAVANGTSNISSVLLINGGSGYTSPTLSAVDSNQDSGAIGATFSVTVVGGVITAITVLTQGANYTPGATQLVITDATGYGAVAQAVITNNVAFSASASVFTSANIGDVIRMGGGKATVVSCSSGTSVIANITQPITLTIPNDPNNTPVPAIVGNWTITTPVSTVSGLNHLEGLTVTALADGSVVPNQTVTNGQIALIGPASAITVGLPYTCQLQTMYTDVQGAPGGTVQTKRKNVASVGLQVENSRGVLVGTNQVDSSTQPNYAATPWNASTGMKEIKQRSSMVDAGSAIPLYTGPAYINVPSDWSLTGQVAVVQNYPLPANILSVVSYIVEGDTGQ